MKILHITSWYPENNKEGIFVEEHINALSLYSLNEVWVVNCSSGKRRIKLSLSSKVKIFKISIPSKVWLLVEFISFLQLMILGILNFRKLRQVDVINFHIAYPNLTYYRFLTWLFPRNKICITEHWSAYHFNFGVSKELNRIKKIFNHNIPLITVSKALSDDIKLFSKCSQHIEVIPNVVNDSFCKLNTDTNKKVLFMLGHWNYPKDPMTILKGFHTYVKSDAKAHLKIGGNGGLLEDIENYVTENELTTNVTFLGFLNTKEVVEEMQKADGFIHCSDYETFSVVCAEAISCGTPVIASRVGGIPEFIDESNGVWLEVNSSEEIAFKIQCHFNKKYDRQEIAKRAKSKFSPKQVGGQYYRFLRSLIDVK